MNPTIVLQLLSVLALTSAAIARSLTVHQSRATRQLTIALVTFAASQLLRLFAYNVSDWYSLVELAANLTWAVAACALLKHVLIAGRNTRWLWCINRARIASLCLLVFTYAASTAPYTLSDAMPVGLPTDPWMVAHWLVLLTFSTICIVLLTRAVFVSLEGACPVERATLLAWFAAAVVGVCGVVSTLSVSVTPAEHWRSTWALTSVATTLIAVGALIISYYRVRTPARQLTKV
ncbi:hypothetical protein SEA_SCHMIDT_33 [Gordonia phage Schmidt]|uniref:Uncharacterized protein n=1 Tax=Gordonia phage Schmidt TaxID=2301697 RepID=A0A385E2Q2_9CAUD|nr:hypothetical protein KDJ59_gp33 [Gordonia phage Schmidt]AXQ65155.1 hypothetical protein SEA_SCHMIDT_33 [Gordonia phage Schmidt]